MPRISRLLIAAIALSQLQLLSYSGPQKSKQIEGLAYATFPGQADPTKDLLAVLVRQARWDSGDFAIGNKQGLKLQFIKVDDQGTPKGTFARYRVLAVGAPENKVYAWSIWGADPAPAREDGDVYVNARGLVMTRKPLPEEEFSLQVPGAEFYISPQADPAVPLRYEMSSRDSQLLFTGTLVPQPVAAQDGGCRLEVRIAQPNAAAVLLLADGFPAESRIPLVLESEGQTANLIMDTDVAGHSIVAGFPYVPGKTQGELKATAEGPDCLPSVTLPWRAETHSAQKTP